MNRLLLLVILLFATPAIAQGPSDDWRTAETAHFRVHYPREYEEWALRAAERLESVRDAVSKEVGFAPPQTIDVLVMNPEAQPNGVAWPFLDTPRMIFFAEPPGPDEQLGAYGHWIDLLAVHETAHLVHMLRPSRNPFERTIERLALPLNPITLRAPRWVLEGYATVVEGRLTGAGRPSSTIRALILRRWAENGRLPSYGQLNSDRRFLGMSMAYLMGSAYLEWLEQRGGPDSLRNLWARMTARHRRSFNDAFIGVFGDRPDRLYARFVAELTAPAMTIERSGERHEGVLFQETPRASGDPAVSPDGTQLAVVIRDRDRPEKLVVWSTGDAAEEEKKYMERVEKILARDPEDVGPVRTKPLPRKAVHSLVMPDGGDIDEPRWMRDGRSLLFAHRVRDGEGFLHFDLYRWDFTSLTRITHFADVRDADPLPDGRTAIALRSRYGASQLVNVDLETGVVTPRTEASIDTVVTHPRVSPDGQHIAHVAHRGGRWTLYVDNVAVATPGDAASPEWVSNEELIVTVFSRGFAELYRVNAVPEGRKRVAGGKTRSGAATGNEVVNLAPRQGRKSSGTPAGVHALERNVPVAAPLRALPPATLCRASGASERTAPSSVRQRPSRRELVDLVDFVDVVDLSMKSTASTKSTTSTNSRTKSAASSTDLDVTPITRASGGAFQPAPSSDGRVFFMSLDPDGYVVRVIDKIEPVSPPPEIEASLVPAIPPQPSTPAAFAAQPVTSRAYGIGRQEFAWFTSTNFGPDQQAVELGVRFGDVVGRLDTLLIGSLGRDDATEGFAVATAWRGWPIELHAHAFTADESEGIEVRGSWSRYFAQSRLAFEAGALSDDLLFGSAAFSTRQVLGRASLDEALRVDVDDDHYRGIASVAYRAGSMRIAARYQRDGGANVTLGGLASSILPRSAYAHRVLDPALPVAILAGDDYDGWRIESTVPVLPLTAFYQRHTLDGTQLSLAGAQAELHTDPNPILKLPALDFTVGAAYVLDAPLLSDSKSDSKGDTKWWLGMRWRP